MRLIPHGSRRERFVVEVGGLLIYLVMRVIWLTSRHSYIGEESIFARFAAGDQLILAFWHGRMVMVPFAYRGRGACIMNSRHRDGALISRAIERLGIEVVHGSSSRGWVGGLKGLLGAAGRGSDLAVVPDGPRGPRCKAKSGVIQLARSTGLPIYPVASSASPHRILEKSWDWMMIPFPGGRIVYVAEDPVWVPADATPEQMKAALADLESKLNRATERADEALGVASEVTREYTRGGKPRARREERE